MFLKNSYINAKTISLDQTPVGPNCSYAFEFSTQRTNAVGALVYRLNSFRMMLLPIGLLTVVV